MKKIIITAILGLIITNCHAYDFSAVCSTGQTLYYNITSDSTVSVVRPYVSSYLSLAGDLIIPDSVMQDGVYYKVVCIEANAFSGCSGIQSLIISDNVISIGEYAFYRCSGIDSLYI